MSNRSPKAPSLRGLARRNPSKGSVLLLVMMGIILLSLIAGTNLSYALHSRSQAVRNTKLLEAQSVAESELDVMFYRWQNFMLQGIKPGDVTALMNGPDISDPITLSADLFKGTTVRQPFALDHRAANWTVKRTFRYDTTLVGQLPDAPKKTGTLAYFTTGIVVEGSGPNAGIAYRLGRRFVMSDVSLFQFAIFYQGDLELAPGSNMKIQGPVAANGSIYAGANQGQTLTFSDSVSFSGSFNGDPLGLTNITMRSPNSPEPVDGEGKPVSKPLTPPVFSSNSNQVKARAKQLKRMDASAPENFLGGLDAAAIQAAYPDLYTSLNDVYRSVIEPPPQQTAAGTTADDPVISARRMYNRAGIRIKISTIGSVTITTSAVLSADASNKLAGVVPTSAVRRNVYDQREAKNVKVTTLDIAKLADAIDEIPELKSSFNGVVYIQDEETSTGVIRVVNGSRLPVTDDGTGLTLATRNALYVQGNYNTQLHDSKTVSASLMADTVTLLSQDWSDDNSQVENKASARKAAHDITVTAGILTGNTATTSSANSGGAQNLVRLMEDWSGQKVTLKGSIGQLFNSAYFTGAFPRTPGTVYYLPSARAMVFDSTIAGNPPPGSPTTTKFSRGDLIIASN